MNTLTGGLNYPFMEAEAGELTVQDVEKLLKLYKDVVTRYSNLSTAYKRLSLSKRELIHPDGSSLRSDGTDKR